MKQVITIKKRILSILMIQFIIASFSFVPAAAQIPIGVYITPDYGMTLEPVYFDGVEPVSVNQRVLIPLRGLFEKLGFSVEWNPENSTAVVKNESKIVRIPLNKEYIYVNGMRHYTDVAAISMNSRTFIPVRVISEAFGIQVDWDQDINGVIVQQRNSPYGIYGSAGFIGDRTVIVSVFASDASTSWNFDDNEHNLMAENTRQNLDIAVSWIRDNVKRYGVNAEFVYDWSENKDLVYCAGFYDDMLISNYNNNEIYVAYLDKYVDSAALLKKYDAKNIIYMFIFNTPFSNEKNPQTTNKMPGDDFGKEIIEMFNKFDGEFVSSPAVYAHEILHCFGAEDLYYRSIKITQEYVDYCKESGSMDIMYTVNTSKTITSVFSDLDAYYVGLIDTCPEVTMWNLGESVFVNYR